MLRLLLALRPILETRVWNDHARSHHGGQLLHDHTQADEQQGDITFKGSSAASSAFQVRHDLASRWSEWRVNAAAGRATYELLVAGVGYLL